MSGLDLYATQEALAEMLLYAAMTGFLMGGIYDALYILRALLVDEAGGRMPLYGRMLLFVEDVLFVAVASVAFILLCYYTNDGQLRAPAFVGMACGFFVYRYTLGVFTRRLAPPLVRCVRSLVKLMLTPVRIPLRWLCHGLGKGRNRIRERLRARRQHPEEGQDPPPPTQSPPEFSQDYPRSQA